MILVCTAEYIFWEDEPTIVYYLRNKGKLTTIALMLKGSP